MADQGYVVQTRKTGRCKWRSKWGIGGASKREAIRAHDRLAWDGCYVSAERRGLARVVRCVAVEPEVTDE